MALPTITPSAALAAIFAWAGVDTPNPTQIGLCVNFRANLTCPVIVRGSFCRAPVTPVSET